VHRIRRQSRLQSCRATRRSLVHTNVCEQTSPQADRGSRCNAASASPNPWRNPHSARGTAGTHFPRFRALALFGRRPLRRVVRPSSRRPKTCTTAALSNRNKSSATSSAISGNGRLLFSLRKRFSDLAGVLDEQLCDWAKRAILQGDDSDWDGGNRQFNRQDLNLRAASRKP
jgi:hypothetical protein